MAILLNYMSVTKNFRNDFVQKTLSCHVRKLKNIRKFFWGTGLQSEKKISHFVQLVVFYIKVLYKSYFTQRNAKKYSDFSKVEISSFKILLT